MESDPTDESLEQRLANPQYKNWIKALMCLNRLKEGLENFTQKESEDLHIEILSNLRPCGTCTEISQLCHACSQMKNGIQMRHIGVPRWTNTDVQKWPDWQHSHWCIAKCYMNDGQTIKNNSAKDSDISALLNFIINCKRFESRTYGHIQRNSKKVRDNRNELIHNGEQKLSDSDLISYADNILELLKDDKPAGKLKGTRDAENAQTKIEEILKASFAIMLEDELKVRFFASEGHIDWINIELKRLDQKLTTELQANSSNQDQRIYQTEDRLTNLSQDMTKMKTTLHKIGESMKDSINLAQELKELKDGNGEIIEKHTVLARLEQESNSQRKIMEQLNLRVREISESFETFQKRGDLQLCILEGNLHSLECKLDTYHKEQTTIKQNVDILYSRYQQDVPSLGGVSEHCEARLQQRDVAVGVQEPEPPTKRQPESNDLRLLKDQTEDQLDTLEKLGHIPTAQAEAARKLLLMKRYVVIKGNPGEGKTTMALHLINNEMYRKRRVVLYHPQDWRNVITDWVDIVILDDIFGKFDLDSDRLQKWMVHLPTIQDHVDAGKLQLIVTTRADILAKAHSMIESLKIFSDDSSLKLSSEQLKPTEKIAILNRELLKHKKDMQDDAKLKCITNFSGLIGFPQCCALFAGDNILFDRGPDFFESPKEFFIANIKRIDHTGFLPLAFLFCNGDVLEEILSHETMPETSKRLLMDLASGLHISTKKASIALLRDTYDTFMNLYVEKSMSYRLADKRPCIRFTHAIVFEAVGQVLGDRCPEMVVKFSDSEYLYQRTYTAETKDITSDNVFLSVSVYGLLAERMVHDIIEGTYIWCIVKHTALKKQDFLIKLKNELQKVNKVKEFFTAKSYPMSIFDPLLSLLEESLTLGTRIMNKIKIKQRPTIISRLSNGHCATFMQSILQNDENVVQLVYNQLLKFLECTQHTDITDCWQCEERQTLLELAIYYHHFQIADKLITTKTAYTHVSLCNACRHGDQSRVQTIIRMLKSSRVFNPECEEAKYALCRAYLSRNHCLTALLLKERIKMNICHVVDAAKQKDLDVLAKIVAHLKYHNNWTPHLEPGRYMELNRNHVLDDAEIDLNNTAEQLKCHKNSTLELELFRPSWHFYKDLSKYISPCFTALYITYSEEKFDMADYLLNNGVKATMDMLMHLSTSSSLKAIARLIQNIKESGNWDPRCGYASKALAKTYISQNSEVFDLLDQEGVELEISSLAFVVLKSSLEPVRKAIQHLKDSDKWDSKSDHASKALEMAWKMKHDVGDLLVQEGVTLRMENFPGIVDSVSLDSVKKAMQHLKDADNWDSMCEDASEALENAYTKQTYDVIDLLLQEGVKLTMKNLPSVVCSVSFEYVKRAIQHLQDTDNWDSKCDAASKALDIAYKKKAYDVADLLVQEGVKLTMKNLPAVVMSDSLEYVKKAIQHLKENVNWDPKCSYASVSLGVCCMKEKHDGFDLLIKEGVAITMSTIHDIILAFNAPQEFVKTAIQHLKDTDNWDAKSDDASKALEMAWKQKHDVCDFLVHEGVMLKMKNFPGIVDSVSLESVKKATQHLKDADNWDSMCEDASEALENAYTKQTYDVIDLLLKEGVKLTMKNHPGVVYGASLEYSKKAIHHLKDIDNWDSKCDYASEALRDSCIQNNYDAFDLLIHEGVLLTMKDLLGVVRSVQASLESVRKAIQHLKEVNNWDSKSTFASEALEIAYIKEKYDIRDLLVAERVKLTMQNLPRLVANSVSLKPVKQAIQYLKDTENWDYTQYDASKALGFAYSQEKYDVCAVLVQGGIPLIMKILPALVTNIKSLESLKKAIQDLKDANNWDSKSAFAPKALVISYSQQKHDVSDLLVLEEVRLTMKELPDAVDIGSFDSIKKAIQHLKEYHIWDSTCDDASKALEIAYSREKREIRDLLVAERVKLTMQNLPRLVANSVSLESVKEAIKSLKDTEIWDYTQYDASKALGFAYSQQKYDVCALLVQGGIPLTMKILPALVRNIKSLESLKKAIQDLKDATNWDSKSTFASTALVIAYSHHEQDVSDLLVLEEVKLTMKELPDAVDIGSFDSIKKAIQHLKQYYIWDSTCDDASKALEIAYSREKREIRDLLVAERVKLTMQNLPRLVANSVSLESVKEAIKSLKDTEIWDYTQYDASKALGFAYSQQKYDVCALLVQGGIPLTMKILPALVRNIKSLESLKKAIQDLKDATNWDSKSTFASTALVIAYSHHEQDVSDLLVLEEVKLTMKELPDAVDIGSFDSIKKAIQHLKQYYIWDSTCDDASKALEIAYSREKREIRDLLVAERVKLTMQNLPRLVANSVSLESVKEAIKSLKDTEIWDYTQCDASKALGFAYSQQKYDVCAVLIQGGIPITMNILPSLVTNIKSLESLKKAIQDLKDATNWDSESTFASKALVIANNQHKHDVSDLLVLEEVRLTMKELPDAVNNGSLESIKMAIQHLKKNYIWDSTCDDASKALEIAYCREKHDIRDLLVAEKVNLTMKNLHLLVSNSASLESFNQAIQYLKDTENWDYRQYEASKALGFAYSQEKYDVCAMLVQWGIPLTMVILPSLVANIKSLESLKKAIQDLKDATNWDSESTFASTALVIAYSHHEQDVSDLLVLEEVRLTMKELPDAVDIGSFDSIKKAIQHLKQYHIWDSSCDEASKALEIAYSRDMYDVYDLLVADKVKLTMTNLFNVAKNALLGSVEKSVQCLKDTDNWDAKCEDASKALEIDWKDKCDVCDLLFQEGVTLTMKNLPGLVGNSVSLESVKKAIQHLKDMESWDSKSDYASKALEMAWKHTFDVCDLLLHEGVTLTMKNLQGVVLNRSSLDSIKHAIQHLKDNDNWDPKSTDAHIAVEFAYRVHEYDVADLLVQEGAILTMKNLPGVVCDVSLEYVKKTIQHLKDNDNWDPKCNDASTALEIAYRVHKYDVIDLLVQEGFGLTMKNFFGVVSKVSLKYVEKVMQNLKDTDKWDPKSACASAALEIAYRDPIHDVFDLLAQEGITLIIMCLPDLVASESLESVKKVIQLLKDTDNWDPKCDDASKALENAFIKQDYGVVDLLVQEGVALTMKNLPIVVDHMSLNTIEKAMQHLKDNGSWDTKSDHATKALETALINQKYDVFAQLVQEGVTLTMKNIPGVVDSVSLRSVGKAVQHLKETGNWDSRCDEASKALELGWKHKYVVDLLAQEGVTLTMKNLPLVVFHESCESIKKAIQHLKDNDNWDCKCDDASEALEAAYSKQKNKVLDLLLKEGVTLTMKNIPHMVDSAALEPIKKAIQHLKDANIWNPKCEHASTALETALTKQKHEVFDLLVQEGITLTMKNFPGVVETVSVKSVKKAIQHLKDTGNWNSKCDDASRAFEIAWKKQCYLCDLLVKEGVTLPMENLLPVVETVSYEEVEQYWSSTCAIMNPHELMYLKQ